LDFPWLGKCCVLFLLDYIFTLDFPWLDLSRDYLLRTVRLPLQGVQGNVDIVTLHLVFGSTIVMVWSSLGKFLTVDSVRTSKV
jgi:hypothetical protein